MKEDFLHYVWKCKKFYFKNLKSTQGSEIQILSVGEQNNDSGPDFFNAKLRIDGQLWAGNVEIHIKSSDWYLHNHEMDKQYDNVILHVVWEDDSEIFRKDNSFIPSLCLKEYISENVVNNYQNLLLKRSKWISCENQIKEVNSSIINNWLEQLYLERLEEKSHLIRELLQSSKNDWEAVLFKMLLKNFGLKVNGEAFLSLANSIDFKIIRKLNGNRAELEAMLFGQANLLEDDFQDSYFKQLRSDYNYLKQKFGISGDGTLPVQFFRLRPSNFPTIRLSQFSGLYDSHSNLFQKIVALNSPKEFYSLFSLDVSNYWKTHYVFDKESHRSKKNLSKSFIDLLIVNTLIPIRFAYYKSIGKVRDSEIFEIIEHVKPEENTLVGKFEELGVKASSARKSQALIQLKNNYCDLNKCLQCHIGKTLLNRNKS
jgi:hypothetical protein